MDEIKPWRCLKNSSHIMGRVVQNGRGIHRLLLYRNAVDETTMETAPDVLAVVEGYVTEVSCSICGGIRPWIPDEEIMMKNVASSNQENNREPLVIKD